jgi:hypothetical protein
MATKEHQVFGEVTTKTDDGPQRLYIETAQSLVFLNITGADVQEMFSSIPLEGYDAQTLGHALIGAAKALEEAPQ